MNVDFNEAVVRARDEASEAPAMTANPYQVLGATPPPMLERAALVERVNRHLLKPSPEHVSVVGPAHYGKSVLLQHLADAHRSGSRHYLTTVHVDLRHAEITSDEDFKRRLAEALKAALDQKRPEHAEHLDPRDENIHEMLGLIFDDLAPERVLVVLDGFDHVLAGADLTRNLWDQLRALAQKPSLRLLAGSRRPLREVCLTEESRTSDFWEIFAQSPIRVTALDEDDLHAFMQPLLDAGCALDGSARKEIANWTGGVPLLVCALLARLWDGRSARLSKPDVAKAAEAVLDEQGDLLAALWDDCNVQLRADLAALASADIARADLSAGPAEGDRGAGLRARAGKRPAKLLPAHDALRQGAGAGPSRTLNASSAAPSISRRTSVRCSRLRLAQVGSSRTDRQLHDYVSRAVGDVGANPELATQQRQGHRGARPVAHLESRASARQGASFRVDRGVEAHGQALPD